MASAPTTSTQLKTVTIDQAIALLLRMGSLPPDVSPFQLLQYQIEEAEAAYSSEPFASRGKRKILQERIVALNLQLEQADSFKRLLNLEANPDSTNPDLMDDRITHGIEWESFKEWAFETLGIALDHTRPAKLPPAGFSPRKTAQPRTDTEKNALITIALAIQLWKKHAKDPKVTVSNVAKLIQDEGSYLQSGFRGKNGVPIQGQSAEGIKDRIEKALDLLRGMKIDSDLVIKPQKKKAAQPKITR